MKTLYAEAGRIQLPNSTLSLVEDAANEVYRLASMHRWHPKIRIDLPKSALQRWEPKYLFDNMQGDNLDIQVWGFYRRSKNAKREIRANLGYEISSPGGFNPHLIANIFGLPEVYFDDLIPHYLLRGQMPLNQRNVGLIHTEHWKVLAGMINQISSQDYRKAFPKAKDAEEKDYFERLKKFYKSVMEASRAVMENSNSDTLDELITTIKSNPAFQPE